MIVKILKDDKLLRLKAGDLCTAEPYWLEPTVKVTILKNLRTGKDPQCNQYWREVEVVDGNKPGAIGKACRDHNKKVSQFLNNIKS